ncbi:MAG: hypothetical protein KDA86_15950 [Planctomycetaceae bacterium]|nr:hypothetical protein [Planctomycetaceae bacterium]
MLWNLRLDPDDPLSQAVKRLKREALRWLIIGAVLVGIIVCIGIPNLLTTYQYQSHGNRYVAEHRRYKTSANYLGPLGWQTVRRGEYGEGLPGIKFLPLHACIDFKRYEETFPFFLLPPEYRDGEPAR